MLKERNGQLPTISTPEGSGTILYVQGIRIIVFPNAVDRTNISSMQAYYPTYIWEDGVNIKDIVEMTPGPLLPGYLLLLLNDQKLMPDLKTRKIHGSRPIREFCGNVVAGIVASMVLK